MITMILFIIIPVRYITGGSTLFSGPALSSGPGWDPEPGPGGTRDPGQLARDPGQWAPGQNVCYCVRQGAIGKGNRDYGIHVGGPGGSPAGNLFRVIR